MLQEIKFDFFKVFKSKSIIITIIATSLLLCVNPIFRHLIQKCEMSAFRVYVEDSTPLLCVTVFSILFCGLDFEKGFIKNIYTSTNKLGYVLSKALIIFLYSLYVSIFLMVVNIVVTYAGGIKQIIQPIGKYTGDYFTIGDVISFTLIRLLGLTAVGLFVTLLYILFKPIVVSIITLTWVFTCNMIYMFLDGIFVTIKGAVSIGNYTLFGNLNNGYITGVSVTGYTISDFAVLTLIAYLFYAVVFFLLSWLALSKKDV